MFDIQKIKEFFSSLNDSPTLTTVLLWLCKGIGQTLRKDDIRDSTLTICLNYLSMSTVKECLNCTI